MRKLFRRVAQAAALLGLGGLIIFGFQLWQTITAMGAVAGAVPGLIGAGGTMAAGVFGVLATADPAEVGEDVGDGNAGTSDSGGSDSGGSDSGGSDSGDGGE